MAGQPEPICQLTASLAEAGGCPKLAPALAGRAGGRVGRSLRAAVFHREAGAVEEVGGYYYFYYYYSSTTTAAAAATTNLRHG